MRLGAFRWAPGSLVRDASIRGKIMGIVAGLTVLLGSAVTLQVRAADEAMLGEELAKRGVSIASDVAERGTDYILTSNSFALHELVRNTHSNNEDVRYVFILDQGGRVLAHSFTKGLPVGLAEAHPSREGAHDDVAIFQTEEGLVRDVAVPILEGRAGTARVGMSDIRLKALVATVTQQLLAATALASLLGLALAYLLTMLLTHPIRELAAVAEAVRAGDLRRQARVSGRDELGQLGEAFNSMTKHLSQSNERLLRRNRELAALNAVATAVARIFNREEMLSASLDKVLEVLELRTGVILVPDPAAQNLVVAAAAGSPHNPAEIGPCPKKARCPCWDVFASGRLRVVVSASPTCPWVGHASETVAGLNAGVCVPLMSKEVCLGVLYVAGADRRALGEEQLSILRSIAHQIGVAMENARLWEELRQRESLRTHLLEKVIATQEEERRRIARELHDETAQGLTALMMSLEAVESEIPAHLSPLRERLARTRQLTARSLDETRRLIQDLRPVALDNLGLVPAIRWYAEHRLEPLDIDVSIEVKGLAGRLPSIVETTVFRIIQEATNNVAKHANARSMIIEIRTTNGAVTVRASDDGQGFDASNLLAPNGTGSNHMGLLGMRERAVLLGGTMGIESAPGRGTRLWVEIPVQGIGELT